MKIITKIIKIFIKNNNLIIKMKIITEHIKIFIKNIIIKIKKLLYIL
jgi:hypothetical protein